jgi:hypothetical protein
VSELSNLFAQFGIQPYLNHTQTLIALVDPDGRLREWNSAFGQMKKAYPGVASLKDFLAASSQSLFIEMMQAKESRQASLELSSAPKGSSSLSNMK